MIDKLLIWRCQRGSRDALRQIYEKYHADLLKLALVLTGDLNTAQDVVHDVFVGFARSVDRLTLKGSLKGYLTVNTVNGVRNRRRSRQRRGECGLNEAAALPAATRPPEQWAILSEQLERLHRAMVEWTSIRAAGVRSADQAAGRHEAMGKRRMGGPGGLRRREDHLL
jgi:DNA-directed RNA polymerase specialized sigma24 family protein